MTRTPVEAVPHDDLVNALNLASNVKVLRIAISALDQYLLGEASPAADKDIQMAHDHLLSAVQMIVSKLNYDGIVRIS